MKGYAINQEKEFKNKILIIYFLKKILKFEFLLMTFFILEFFYKKIIGFLKITITTISIKMFFY